MTTETPAEQPDYLTSIHVQRAVQGDATSLEGIVAPDLSWDPLGIRSSAGIDDVNETIRSV